MKSILSLIGVAVVAGAPTSAVLADRPGADIKPIAEIVEQLERDGYGPFIEASFDLGRWEVEVYKQDVPYELAIDGKTGKVLSEVRDDSQSRPPKDAQPLSRILQSLVKAGGGDISEVSFERRYWEIEVYRADGKHEVLIDPTTGETINDRRDD